MKMSDHFAQDLKACDITNGLGNTKFGLVDSYGIATGKMQMEAAAHAIKQHDALVEALEGCLSNLLMHQGEKKGNGTGWAGEAEEALAEEALAKELSHEG